MPLQTNQGLHKVLLAKKGVSPQAISQNIKRLRRKLGALSTEDGWGILAALQGVDVSKYLSPEDVARIRGLVTQVKTLDGQAGPATPRPARRGLPASRTATVTVAPALDSADPILPTSVAAEAKMMAEQVYPRVYILENSMRSFIVRILEAAHGKKWWDTKVPEKIRKAVAFRMTTDERMHWHGKRGAHPIYYSDFSHLAQIVEANWSDFANFLPSKGFFTQKVEELNVSRRVVAHCNPLSKHDQQRLQVYSRDWENHVTGIAASLP